MHSCSLFLHRRQTSNGNLLAYMVERSERRIMPVLLICFLDSCFFWYQDMVVHPINAESEVFVADQEHQHTSGDHDARIRLIALQSEVTNHLRTVLSLFIPL